MRSLRHWLAAVGLLTLAACVGPLDNASTVHDLRILGISADPPELDYPVQDIDAGLFSIACPSNFFGALESTQAITLSALVGDPAGGGRTLHYVFTGCPQSGSEICPDGGGYVLAEGDSPAPVLTATWSFGGDGGQLARELEVATTCQPGEVCPPTPLLDTFGASTIDTCRFGVWFQVGLEVDAPGDGGTVFGSTIMVFTPVPQDYPTDPSVCPQGPDGGPPPHTNPQLEAFDLDGEALPLEYTPSVSASYSHTLRPIEPSNGPQPYCLPQYTGGWASLTETWLYSAMTTVGQFSAEQLGGAAPLGSDETGPSTDLNFTWTFPDGGVGLTADLYEVTRDGRGGTSWLIRHAAVTP